MTLLVGAGLLWVLDWLSDQGYLVELAHLCLIASRLNLNVFIFIELPLGRKSALSHLHVLFPQ